DAQAVVTHAIGAASSLTVIGRVQSSFGDVLPSSELFDLTGLDSLSPFTAGALSADGGVSLRGELAHRVSVTLGGATLNASPYVFGAVGSPDSTIEDPFTPSFASAYGAGLRLAGNRFPLGAAPTLTLEYGRHHANRGAGSGGRLSVLFGVSF
ncbi:MAG TPA: hypothetical protein VM055_01635, partial [Novosphingobium sp.]|nr:hypothetical protein [Novosphingobium sp.]